MQSRRTEEHDELSPTVKLRSQRRVTASTAASEVGPRDPCPVSYRPPPARGRRSYSPNVLDVSRRGALIRDRRNGSMDGRDSCGWHLGSGSTEKGRSRSPRREQMRKRPHVDDDDGVVNKKYDYVEPDCFDDSTNFRVRTVYRYDHGASRMSKEKDYMEDRVTNVDGHVTMRQKLIPVEDFEVRRPHRLPQELDPSLNYAETSGQVPLSSQGIDIGQYDHEKLCHQESVPSNKVKVIDSYKEEKPMFISRDVAYDMVPASHSKDFSGTSQFKDFAGPSSRITRTEVLSSYQDDEPLPVSDEYLRSSKKPTEHVGYNKYEQRSFTDFVRDPESARRNITLYQQRANSPSRVEYEDYIYRKHRAIGSSSHGNRAEDIERMMPSQSQVSIEHASIDYSYRDVSKPNMLPHVDRTNNTNDCCGNLRKGILWDDHICQKQINGDYVDVSRSYASMQGGEYLASEHTHLEYGRRLPQDYEMSHSEASYNYQVSYSRSDYGYCRGVGPEFQNERLINSPVSKYDAEQCRHGLRTKRMEEELDLYSDRIIESKLLMEEDVGRPSSKTIVSSKLHSAGQFGGSYDSKEMIDGDINGLHGSRTKGYDRNEFRKVGRTYDVQDHQDNMDLDDWYTSEGSLAHLPRVPIRYYKNSGKFIKGNPRPSSFNWHTSHQNDRRSNLHKQKKVSKGNEDYDEDINANDGDMTEDLVNYAEAELSEDSEEFKQLVHEAFLKYSKKLNLSQSVRRRYKEQGRAGSLFCIVCGRSYSKEFMDTQRLVTHAFMSHKVGLRAEHLGLHRAICVLLGWSSIAPPDTITWVPEVLPEAEGFAQKEDLVLWPPVVVIHNISMAINNPQEQKVVPIEGVQAFLRGKGFVGGKITVCLGRPADQSVMVVKFLGTFTGLATAERLHKYFVDKKQGRGEFQQIMSHNNGKSISGKEMEEDGDKLKERLLYGYMAIAEDLDKLDFNNRKWSLVKSKKEILELANDPVKIDER